MRHVLVILFRTKAQRPGQRGVQIADGLLAAHRKPQVVFPIGKSERAVVVTARHNHNLRGFPPVDHNRRLDTRVRCPESVAVNVDRDLNPRIFLEVSLDGLAGAVV